MCSAVQFISWHQGQLTKLIPLLIEIANSSSGPIQEDCVHHHANMSTWDIDNAGDFTIYAKSSSVDV